MDPDHAGIPGNEHVDSLRKGGISLATAMVPCSSPQLSPKLVKPSVTNGDFTFPHSLPSQLPHFYSFSVEIGPLPPHMI